MATMDRGTARRWVRSINLSGTSGTYTAQRLQPGVNRIRSTGSGAGWDIKLPRPSVGADVTIVATIRSTAPLVFHAHSTAVSIAGTTANTITMSTGGSGRERVVRLLGLSPTAWSLLNASTGVSLSATTSPF